MNSESPPITLATSVSSSLPSVAARIAWVDVLRGIGILAVIAGHIVADPAVVAGIFLFHMPLFFLVGGYLHRPETPGMDLLRSRAAALLLPYICYLLILWPLELLAAFPNQAWTEPWLLHALVKPMLLGGPLLKGYAAVFWFVTCYFLTQQLVHLLLKYQPPRRRIALLAVMLAAAYLQAALWPAAWLPWSAHTVLFTAPLYYLGYCAQRVDLIRLLPLFGIGAVVALALAVQPPGNTLDLKYGIYGVPLLTVFGAMMVVGLLAGLARFVQPLFIGDILAALGRASLTLMFLHQPIQLGLRHYFGVESELQRFVAALLLACAAHVVLGRLGIGRRLFLGRAASPRALQWRAAA